MNDTSSGCVSLGWGTTAPSDGAEVLPVGVLVRAEELRANPPRRMLGAVVTAVAELEAVRVEGQLGLPAVVAVACDEANAAAVDHLTRALEVRIVLGPDADRDVVPVVAQLGSRAALFSPFADSPALDAALAAGASGLDDAGGSASSPLLVTCKPNRESVRPYLLDAIAEARALIALRDPALVPLLPALAVSGDVPTARFADGIDDSSLDAAGVRRVRYTTQPRGLGLVSALGALDPAPNFVVAASAEDAWQDNIEAFDGASHADGRAYPYYLLADKRPEVVAQTVAEQLTAAGAPRQYLRVLGLDYQRGEQSRLALSAFAQSFQALTGGRPVAGLEYAYDCAYLAIYAALAARLREGLPNVEPSPEQIGSALSALSGGGPTLPVGPLDVVSVLGALAAGGGRDASLDLVGSSGGLDLGLRTVSGDGPGASSVAAVPGVRHHGVVAPDGELYCIDSLSKELCDMGIVFPKSGGPPRRSPSACACFGAE